MSNVNIDLNVIEKLLYKYPNNIVGIKDSSGDIDNMLKMIKIFNRICSPDIYYKKCLRIYTENIP